MKFTYFGHYVIMTISALYAVLKMMNGDFDNAGWCFAVNVFAYLHMEVSKQLVITKEMLEKAIALAERSIQN